MTLEKKYNGAPFGQQADRFSSSGVHPRNRKPGTFLHLSNKARSTSADVGPGKYDPEYGGFSEKAVADRALGPGWERQYEVSRMTALPYLLNKEEWEMKKFLKNKLGPGSYFTKDILKESIKKPVSKRGMLSMRETRFKDDLTSDIPGPGTYGKGGIPHAVLEEKERQSFGTVGMLECGGSGVRSLPNMGSQLGPGTYNFEGSVDHLLKKTVGLRGAYDVFSIDRSKPIPTGHYSVLVSNKLGPGQYESKSTFDDLNSHSKKYQGRFGKLDRTSGATCDRIIACTLSVCPRDPSDPGPGQYEASNPNHRPLTQGKNLPAFLSSTQRTDKTATKFFTGNFNPVGTGRYDIQKFEEAQDINGHQSIFRSKTTPPNGVRKKFMDSYGKLFQTVEPAERKLRVRGEAVRPISLRESSRYNDFAAMCGPQVTSSRNISPGCKHFREIRQGRLMDTVESEDSHLVQNPMSNRKPVELTKNRRYMLATRYIT